MPCQSQEHLFIQRMHRFIDVTMLAAMCSVLSVSLLVLIASENTEARLNSLPPNISILHALTFPEVTVVLLHNHNIKSTLKNKSRFLI